MKNKTLYQCFMNIRSILILIITITSFNIQSEELSILNYKTGTLTDDFQCEFKFYDNWLLDEYSCEIDRKEFDKVKIYSDKWTFLVGRIYRYLIVDKNEIEQMKNKLTSTYGSPKEVLYQRGSSVNQRMFWGDAIFEFDMQRQQDLGTKFYHPAFPPFMKIKDNEIALQVKISDCISKVSSCYDEFNISDNSTKVVFEFNLINDEIRSINASALSLQKDPRTKKKKQDVKNNKVEEIEI